MPKARQFSNWSVRQARQFSLWETRLLGESPDCPYCGCRLWDGNASVDHKIPRSRGGANLPDNTHFVCRRCNTRKADRTHDEWLTILSGL